jgi:transposase
MSPRSPPLGRTLAAWRTEILAHHETGASNGPTEGLNLCVKKVKRCGHEFRTFEHYGLFGFQRGRMVASRPQLGRPA